MRSGPWPAAAARLLALLLVGVTAVACSDPAPPEVLSERDRVIAAGDAYVALGDSYTAGYLTGESDPAAGGCLRSLGNYPRLLAADLELELTDVSCGGATTQSVTVAQTLESGESAPPQIDAVGPDTALVTIGLGGNDYNLFGALIVGCVLAAQTDPTGAPCTEMVEDDPRGERNIARIRNRLVTVVRKIHEKAPKARILLVGYPQAFPESGGCEQLPLAVGDVPLAYAALRSLNSAVSSAARKTGAEYVDVWAASAGHDICSADPWVAGAVPQRPDGPAYHPYPEEQALVARLVADVLENKGSGT